MSIHLLGSNMISDNISIFRSDLMTFDADMTFYHDSDVPKSPSGAKMVQSSLRCSHVAWNATFGTFMMN